jgi:AAHS family 4-hydroxybenzoate transporter-like MFS transporter
MRVAARHAPRCWQIHAMTVLPESACAVSPAIDITALIERQQLRGFSLGLIAWCFVIVLIDGYDQVAAAYAAPTLVRAWHVKATEFGHVFGYGLVGVLVGSLVLGFLGDRIGRRLTIIYGVLWFGILTLACSRVASLDQLTVLRFVAGIGMGGVVPNTVALVSEYAPKARRATWITLMFSGFSIGAGGGGAIASWMLPRFGWPVLFEVGGVAAIAVALVSFAVLPESVRFLILSGRAPREVARIARRLGSDRVFNDAENQAARYIAQDEKRIRATPLALFGNGLVRVTPLLWALFVLNSLALHFLQNWLPILFSMSALPAAQAAKAAMMFPVGGTVGALALCRCVDRFGIAVILLLALVGLPVCISLGMPMPALWLYGASFMSGVCVIGSQFALYAVAGMVYPTMLRSAGVGSAIGIGKLGSVIGSVLGGVLLAMHLPIADLFMNVSGVFIFIALLSVWLGWNRRRAASQSMA